jgi:FkbM family methyltransferase
MAVTSAIKWELKKTAVKYCPRWLAEHWMRTGRCEREAVWLQHLCEPSRIAIDIGALEGQYTAMALAYSKSCYAFEPQPQRFAKLQDFFAKVPGRVIIEQMALSDRDGVAVMRSPRLDQGRATIARHNPMENMIDIDEFEVRCRRLDDYGFTEVGFIKIDVEGHEEAVIEGARDTIHRDKPNLLIEIEERHNPGGFIRIWTRLRDWGYTGYFMERDELRPLTDFSIERHQNDPTLACEGGYINNFIFSCDPKVRSSLRPSGPHS